MYYKKIMGLDVGDKRIGIAMSDLLRFTAQGIETYNRADDEKDMAYIANMFKENDAEYIVCGLPKNMNGTVGPQAEKVMAFADAISEKFGIRIVYVDERLTTVQAERMLIEADVSRGKRRKVIDKLAAVNILQSHLDSIRTF